MAFKFNYFKNIENKYKTRFSLKKPIVIRLDGKNVCKNPAINLLDETKQHFSFSLNHTAKAMSRKFKAICFSSTDEINILILDPSFLLRHYNTIECQKLSSFVAQEVFSTFNNLYIGEKIFFDARTFNIPENKAQSYISYRVGMAKNVYTNYYAKKLLSPRERVNVKLDVLDSTLNTLSEEYRNRSNHNTYGAIYYNGYEIQFSDLPSTQMSITELISFLSGFKEDTVIYDLDTSDNITSYETDSNSDFIDDILL